ncbi:MAG: tetratricopeptide repeat protein [Taibaiella sp.]|nr:tetratricopeptide repeat protein [Taibaiella sp.]
MNKIITAILLGFTINSTAQTAQDHFRDGLAKHKNKDYKSAIKEYSKAIKMIPNYRDALYNKANCELELKEYELATADFTKVIEADPKYGKAYFSRGYVTFTIGDHEGALPDLDEAIKLDFRIPNALTLRGQIRGELKNFDGACADFKKAKAIGDPNAEELMGEVCDK